MDNEKGDKMFLPENFLNWTLVAMVVWIATHVVKILFSLRVQKNEITELRSAVEMFLQPKIRFYIGNVLQRRIKMKDTEKATAAIELDDAKGFPTGGSFDQPPVWAIDDESIASLAPSADGMSCDVLGGKPGNAKLSVAGVVGGVSYVGECPVVVTAGDPTQIKVSLGEAVPQ